jgi:tRNA (guanosine-2'-O-)-methyltransferase
MHIAVYDQPNTNNTTTCIAKLQQEGYKIVATTPYHPTVELPRFRPKQKVALFFGTEETGLSKEAVRAADERLSIPILGFADSFNVSVAAALVLQHTSDWVRTHLSGWELGEAEKLELEVEWLAQSLGEAGALIKKKYEKAGA